MAFKKPNQTMLTCGMSQPSKHYDWVAPHRFLDFCRRPSARRFHLEKHNFHTLKTCPVKKRQLTITAAIIAKGSKLDDSLDVT